MANVGVEHIHYFCPRRRTSCSLVLYFITGGKGKTYNLIECDKQLDCVVYKPDQESVFDWEYCPAYKEYVVV
jgi:hypothetical protein